MRLEPRIDFISAAQTRPLRRKVLRPLGRAEDCVFPGDDDPMTFHLGLFQGGQLAVIATFMNRSHRDFSAGNPYRLRGMAADEKFRGRGYGGLLLRAGIEVLRARRCDLLWFDARVSAFSFYQGLGFALHGELFHTPGGPHKTMYKHLIPR